MSGDLKVYSIDASSGALTPRSTVSSPAAGSNALITPDGRFLYDTTTNGIYEFSIDASTGALTQLAGSPVAYHIVPGPGVIHPSGKFLYVTNADPSLTSGAQLSAWSIDAQTGELGAIPLSASAVTAGTATVGDDRRFGPIRDGHYQRPRPERPPAASTSSGSTRARAC